MKTEHQKWEIKPEAGWFDFNFRELFQYKDLLFRLVRKDFLSSYQQTVLGPFWTLFQPILTVFVYILVFDQVIGISTEGLPAFPYYLAGIILWNLFSDLFSSVSYTFTEHAEIFEKIYFPRLIAPLSGTLLNLIRFGMQLLLLFIVLIYYYSTGAITFHADKFLLFIPAILIVTGIAFGAGLIFAVLTTKYRDFFSLMHLIMRLLMFVCPIFYTLALVPEKIRWIVNINPMSAQFELFRYSFLGVGYVTSGGFLYSFIAMLLILSFGILLFNKYGDKLLDVV